MTAGRRVDASAGDEGQYPYPRLTPGEYGKRLDGVRYGCPPQPPGDPFDYLYANLARHAVNVHPDGTVTVTPSILVSRPGGATETWHGFLEGGRWREC